MPVHRLTFSCRGVLVACERKRLDENLVHATGYQKPLAAPVDWKTKRTSHFAVAATPGRFPSVLSR
jgi:hypothetical protein